VVDNWVRNWWMSILSDESHLFQVLHLLFSLCSSFQLNRILCFGRENKVHTATIIQPPYDNGVFV